MDWHFLIHPFALGLELGLVFTALVSFRLWREKGELKRFKRHLSDKLEIEAETLNRLKREAETLRKENDNLRLQVGSMNQTQEVRLVRDLEIFARAEKRMIVSAPGFAPAWENAKAEAQAELADEEAGRSLPKRVFSKLFGAPAKREEKALPDSPA